jgi:hypothetical protein
MSGTASGDGTLRSFTVSDGEGVMSAISPLD